MFSHNALRVSRAQARIRSRPVSLEFKKDSSLSMEGEGAWVAGIAETRDVS